MPKKMSFIFVHAKRNVINMGKSCSNLDQESGHCAEVIALRKQNVRFELADKEAPKDTSTKRRRGRQQVTRTTLMMHGI